MCASRPLAPSAEPAGTELAEALALADAALLGICAVHCLTFLPGTLTQQAIEAAHARAKQKAPSHD